MLEFQFNNEHKDQKTLFADVILPLPLPNYYTYRVPFELNDAIAIGSRIVVPFGKSKVLTAIVAHLHETPPSQYEAKYILDLLDDVPAVTRKQLQFYEWIAKYYMCTLGEVINVALPSGLKITSESHIQLNPGKDTSNVHFSLEEQMIINALEETESLKTDDLVNLTGTKNNYKIIKSLVSKEVVLVFQEVKEKYVPKRLKKIRLTEKYILQSTLEQLFKDLEKKPKQLNVLLKYLQHIPILESPETNENGCFKKDLLSESVSESSLRTLIKNNVFEEFEIIVNRFDDLYESTYADVQLSAIQNEKLEAILSSFEEKNIILLHGITGSGKTEIYIELIKSVIDSGHQVLYLLPEIALTTQIVQRLLKVFGDRIGVYHSKYSDNERVDVWKGTLSGRFDLIIGVRSSVFLPFNNLGLIIVDEEHDSSYKQHDPAPRYNARDSAMVLGKMHNAKVLLGSATPSIESYYHAQKGAYGFVEIKERFAHAHLPAIHAVKPKYTSEQNKLAFSDELLNAMKVALENKEQIIIFQNRRGYSSFILCEDCNEIPYCPNCAVSLTYHMYSHDMRCHYCGYLQAVPTNCPSCGSRKIKPVGLGTERIEDDISKVFEEATIQRMDLDTTRKKYSYEHIIEDFSSGRTNILVGTQMLSKGMDFGGVSIVGIFDADRMIHFPDFRSHERAFQMLTQVSGRAGRREKEGHVFIQTNNPDHPLVSLIKTNNYSDFFKNEIREREEFKYPPFVRLIKITVRHVDVQKADRTSFFLSKRLINVFGSSRIIGPQEPIVSKIRNQYLMSILLKLERKSIDLDKAKAKIIEAINHVYSLKDHKACSIVIDVDPVN